MKKVLLLTCAFFTLLFSSCNKDDYSDLTTPSVEKKAMYVDFARAEATPEFFNSVRSDEAKDIKVIDVKDQVGISKVRKLLQRKIEFAVPEKAMEVEFELPDATKATAIVVPMQDGSMVTFVARESTPDDYAVTFTDLEFQGDEVLQTTVKVDRTEFLQEDFVNLRADKNKSRRARACSNATRVAGFSTAATWVSALGGPVTAPATFVFGAMATVASVSVGILC